MYYMEEKADWKVYLSDSVYEINRVESPQRKFMNIVKL